MWIYLLNHAAYWNKQTRFDLYKTDSYKIMIDILYSQIQTL